MNVGINVFFRNPAISGTILPRTKKHSKGFVMLVRNSQVSLDLSSVAVDYEHFHSRITFEDRKLFE